MGDRGLTIGVVGAGIGGLAVTVALMDAGYHVDVYEQARQFARIGAGIQMLPNSSAVLRGLGILEDLETISFKPYSHLNREWDTGEIRRELPMPASLFGAPFLCMHRADLHAALCGRIAPENIHLSRRLVGIDARGDSVQLDFEEGESVRVDAVIGADGVHSKVREAVIGPDLPIHRGRIAYRSVFDAALLRGGDIGRSRTKWWGLDRHIVIYYTRADRSQLYLVTSVPESGDWVTEESWSAVGEVHELRDAFSGFHGQVQMVLDACPECHKWAILEREPLERWSSGRVVLLGDACHPMTPYMAQGGASAIEDAAVLTRCIAEVEGDDLPKAFARYESNRKPRTSRIQAISSANTWMSGGDDDTSWLYGYNAWEVPLT